MPAAVKPVLPTHPLFGEWWECADGRAHYVLAGKCLCACAANPVKNVQPRDGWGGGIYYIVRQCGECVLTNTKRWQRGGR